MSAATADGFYFSFFDSVHWARVRAARRELGLPHRGKKEGPIEGHYLTGRRLKDVHGVEHVVQSVDREWFQGYCVSLALKTDQGYLSRVYVNGTSKSLSAAILSFADLFPDHAAEVMTLS